MNAAINSLPSIIITPPSSSEQETDNVTQTIFTAPKDDQITNYDSPDDGLDGPLPAARSIPMSRPAQSTSNTSKGIYPGNSQIQYYWDRDQTHKLHLDLHLPRHHRRQQPKQDEGSQGIYFNWEHDKMHKLHLKLHLPRHSSLSSPIRPKIHSDGIEAPIVLMTTVPALKYHQHLECITYPRLTQKQYEQRVLTRE